MARLARRAATVHCRAGRIWWRILGRGRGYGDAHDEWLQEAHGKEIARKVREELARRRISRQALADMARISISTLEKALSGRRSFTSATVISLEEALGSPLRARPAPAAASDFAPEELAGCARGAVRWLEGRYLTLRPWFSAQPESMPIRQRSPGNRRFPASSSRNPSAATSPTRLGVDAKVASFIGTSS